MAALILLVPLAATSTHGAIRKLGARRWQALHRLTYPAALLIAVHFILRVKGFQWEPWIYAGIAGALLAMRIRTGPSRP
jgi:sulfoxide reductase heme-binding subunit YedZ